MISESHSTRTGGRGTPAGGATGGSWSAGRCGRPRRRRTGTPSRGGRWRCRRPTRSPSARGRSRESRSSRRGRSRPATVLASPRSLTISSEWPSDSTSVCGHRLDVVGQLLELAVVVDRRRERVLVDVLGVLDGAPDALIRVSTSRRRRRTSSANSRSRGAVDSASLIRTTYSPVGWWYRAYAGRVRASVLHRLQHRGHVAPDPVRAVAVLVDDPRDSAHVTRAVPPGTRRAPSR